MKKIITSISIIAIVAVVVVGATVAFYNDTETSTGNIFTAGSIDLKVDHTKQTYNGVDCETCSVEIKSDATNEVVAKNGLPVTPYNASALSFIHPAWTASVPGATWIWEANPVSQADTNNNVTYTFRKTFTWFGPISGATINLAVASDNSYVVYLNGTQVGADASENNFASADTIVNIDDNIVQGTNILEVVVKNKALAGSNPASNPAGLLYKLTINGNCGAEYFQNQCSLWQETDLTNQKFFNFNDVKPGDFGTNVISLHVYDNDAYSCLIVGNKDDQENPAQPLAPEIVAGDANGVGNPLGDGELSNFLNVFTWGDTVANGVYDVGETSLGGVGPLSTTINIMSMDSLNQQFLTATTTKNIGLAWCAGTLGAVAGQPFSCDGNGMGNIAQSDSFSASLTAYAEQVRNNPTFSCGGVNLPTQGDGNGEALGPAPVGLLSATNFAIIAKTAITDAGAPLSDITGNIAIDPAAGSAITDVSCTNVLGGGKIYNDGGYTGGYNANVGCEVVSPVTALAVRLAMETAYTDAAGRTGPTATELGAGNIGGMTLAPGLYKWSTGVTIPTNVTLSGGVNDVWIFQISGTLDIASGGSPSGGADVVLIGGAQAKNVFWQVTGATTLGTYSTFNGTILAKTNIAIQTGAVLNGRALAQTAVTLNDNTVTLP